MTTVAIVYHSGYGHTAVVAEAVAEGVRGAGAEVALLRIESASQDFQPFLDAVGRADAVIFGAPTYMGAASAPFKAFADASSKPWMTQAWKDKIAAGFTNSQSFAVDKLGTLTEMAVLAAQHGMVWVGQGEQVPFVPAAERGPDTINRVGSFLGLSTQADNAPADVTPPEGDRETARRFGARVAQATRRWAAGRALAAAA